MFTASHDGYSRLPDPVIHRRWVFSWKTGLLFVRDVAAGRAVHDLAVHWHLGPEFVPWATPTGIGRGRAAVYQCRGHIPGGRGGARLTFAAPDGAALTFAWPDDPAWSCDVVEGEWSPAYGASAAACVLRYRARAPLPAEFAVALSPGAPGTAVLERLPGNALAIYRYDDGTDALLILFHDGAGSWEWEGWESDAAFLCFGRHAGEPWLFAPDSARLQFRGQEVRTPIPPESALAALD